MANPIRMLFIPQPGSYTYSSPTYLSPTNMQLNMVGHVMPSSQSNSPNANEASGENAVRKSREQLHANYVALHVAGLSKAVRDENLFEFFRSAGLKIVTVKVCRDVFTKDSLGYGYANFLDHADAATAIEKLNYTVFYGKSVRLTWSLRDSEARNSCAGKLYLKNLATSIGEKRLYEIFSESGKVVSVKVARKADRSSLGYGYVQFESQELADAAIKTFNDTIVDGKKLLVTHYVRKSDRNGSHQDEFNNLYVKNIDMDFDEVLIRLKFSEFGPILSVKIEKDENGNPKGFGFVCFQKPENAKTAMEKMNGLQLGNKTLYVAKAMKRAERAQFLESIRQQRAKERKMKTVGLNVYVKNLREKIDGTILQKHFSQCGTITSAKVMCNDDGVSKGFGFVCFSSSEEAQKAVATFHRQFFYGKPLYVAIAEKKEDRRVKLAQHFANIAPRNAQGGFVHAAYQPNMYYTAGSPYLPYGQGYVAQPYRFGTSWPSAGAYYPATSSSSGVTISPVESPPSEKIRGRELKSNTPDSTLVPAA